MWLKVVFVIIFTGYLSDGLPNKSKDPSTFSSSSKEAVHRIMGGIEAPSGFAPHMVSLVIDEVVLTFICGGSLVTTRHVLTAAHCIDTIVSGGRLAPTLRGVFGSNEWAHPKVRAKFSDFTNHPNWDISAIKYDVGVLKMEHDLKIGLTIQPVELEWGWIEGGEPSYVTGWGRTGDVDIENDVVNLRPIPDKLQLLHLDTITPQQCTEAIDSMFTWLYVNQVNPDIEICTYHSVGHGMCHGDSGSALMSEKTGKQIGIVSWGFPCAIGAPDIYTRISGVAPFVIGALSS